MIPITPTISVDEWAADLQAARQAAQIAIDPRRPRPIAISASSGPSPTRTPTSGCCSCCASSTARSAAHDPRGFPRRLGYHARVRRAPRRTGGLERRGPHAGIRGAAGAESRRRDLPVSRSAPARPHVLSRASSVRHVERLQVPVDARQRVALLPADGDLGAPRRSALRRLHQTTTSTRRRSGCRRR